MVKLIALGIVALVLSVFGASAYAQTATPTPTTGATTTATPTPTTMDTTEDDVTVPSGAPSTGYGSMR